MKNLLAKRSLIRVIESFFTTWALMKAGRMEPGNLLTVVFFFLVCLFYRYVDEHPRLMHLSDPHRTTVAAAILSVVFSVLYVAVDYPNYIAALTNPLFRIGVLVFVFVGFIFLFYYLVKLLLGLCSAKEWLQGILLVRRDAQSSPKFVFYQKHPGLCAFLLCLIFWLPYYLYQYPGVMTPDSLVQFEQVLGVIPYSNHHPWVHTMLIKLIYSIGFAITGNMLISLSLYTLFQMCMLALSVSYFINTLKRYRVKPIICFIITLFYALVPYHAVYSVTLWKDILFAAGVLCFGCSTLRLYQKITAFNLTAYIVSGLILCLFRSNGWYAFLLCLPFLLVHFRKKAKIMFPALIGIFAAALVIKYPVMNGFHVAQPDFIESLSIPAQQITAVICNDRAISDEDIALIENVVDLTYIKELYDPYFADNIKELVRAGNQDYLVEHKLDFLMLWLRLGLKYPGDYLTAYIHQTYGYWYPDSFYPVADAEGVSATSLGVSHTPLIGGPLVIKTKEIAIKLGSMVPLYGTLWSMGVVCWVLLFCIGSAFVRREKRKFILYLPSIALLLTVLIATPVATEFRYVYFMIFSLPFYLMVLLLPERETEAN